MRLRPVLSAVATGAAALGLLLPSSAAANPVTCNVNASAGYVNCLTFTNPSVERVQALHTTGLRYRFQLQRASPAATWGWWEYNDLDTHIIPVSASGDITAQIDNRGSANPAAYKVSMG